MSHSFYAITVNERIVRWEDDGRLCVYSLLGDAVAAIQKIGNQVPGAQIAEAQLTFIGMVPAVAQPSIAGLAMGSLPK